MTVSRLIAPDWKSIDNIRLLNAIPLLIFGILALADYSGSFALGLSLSGDTTITLARALAGISPQIFESDFLFDQRANYSFYNNATVGFLQLGQLLGVDTVDAPYNSLRVLGGIVTFVFLVGHYWLALYLTTNRAVAAVYALTTAIAVTTSPGDYWGLYQEPQARVIFSALLPFLLLYGMRADLKPMRWFAVFFLAGIGVWIHPASGPPIAAALLLAMMVANYDRATSLTTFLAIGFFGGTVFLAIGLPNVLQYIEGVRHAGDHVDAARAAEIIKLRYQIYSDVTQTIIHTFAAILAGWRVAILVLAGVALWSLHRTTDGNQRRNLKFIVTFTLCVAGIACLIPMFEEALAHARGENSKQLDIVRSIRYIIPLLILVVFWYVSRLRISPIFPAVLVAALWFGASRMPPSTPLNPNLLKGVKCWQSRQAICDPTANRAALEELLAFIRTQTSSTEKFFSPDYGIYIRALARRPLVFDWKDFGWLAYSNHARLVENELRLKDFLKIRADESPNQAHRWLRFGSDAGADYIVLRSLEPLTPSLDERVVFSNAAGRVIAKNVPGR